MDKLIALTLRNRRCLSALVMKPLISTFFTLQFFRQTSMLSKAGLIMLMIFPAILHGAENDGPFGVDIGSEIGSYESCVPLEGKFGYYSCSSTPKSHPAFERYVLQAYESTGVCWVKGIGKNIDDNSYGISTKTAAEELAGQIARSYTAHTTLADFILTGALWDDANEWLMSISQNERTYAFMWESEDGYESKNRVGQIIVAIKALGRDTGYIVAEFYGDNYEACGEEEDLLEGSSF